MLTDVHRRSAYGLAVVGVCVLTLTAGVYSSTGLFWLTVETAFGLSFSEAVIIGYASTE